MFTTVDTDREDWIKRFNSRLANMPIMRRLISMQDRAAAQTEVKKREYIRNYFLNELKPHFEGMREFTNNSILHGLFKGIEFREVENLQGGILQKLLGVYEAELIPFLNIVRKREYDFVLNIGAAEGMYSIAFEKMWPTRPIYSFEEDYHTRQLLRRMCEYNDTQNVVVLGALGPSHIEAIDTEQRGFVLCDVDGFESVIFSKKNLSQFKNCDLIIETHDHNAPNVTETLMKELSQTHVPEELQLMSLRERAELITEPRFLSLSKTLQEQLLDSNRNPLNRWIVAHAKS